MLLLLYKQCFVLASSLGRHPDPGSGQRTPRQRRPLLGLLQLPYLESFLQQAGP